MKTLRRLVNERLELVDRAAQIANKLRSIPKAERKQYEFSLVRISDLPAEEQSKIIRFKNKER